MPDPEVFICGTAAATPFGASVRENLDALFAGRTAFAEPRHFDAKGRLLGIDPDLDGGSESRAFRLLRKLRDAIDFPIPAGTRLRPDRRRLSAAALSRRSSSARRG